MAKKFIQTTSLMVFGLLSLTRENTLHAKPCKELFARCMNSGCDAIQHKPSINFCMVAKKQNLPFNGCYIGVFYALRNHYCNGPLR